MGLRFASSGAAVLLGGAVGPEASKLISENKSKEKGEVTYASHVRDSFCSNLPVQEEGKDEIHLIMEFGAKENWAGLIAPRANRFIVHCDHTSSRYVIIPPF